jgi:ubiquinone/menaquinone biosynthesis C-methylase UbiE
MRRCFSTREGAAKAAPLFLRLNMSDESPTTQTGALPDYAKQLAAFHDGFAAELRAIVDSLPLEPGMRVLDMACGDGFYTRLLSERVGRRGCVVGLDSSHDYLKIAPDGRWDYVCGQLERLPFESGSFDFVWCAQSLYSLPEPIAALRRLREMLRPGGVIGVLENDTIH